MRALSSIDVIIDIKIMVGFNYLIDKKEQHVCHFT